MRHKIPMRTRFDASFVVADNGCWMWQLTPMTNGYGRIKNEDREQIPAHRAAWLLYRGPIPDGMQICHKCDTPLCVNPDHLFVGSSHDNHQDAIKKGRRWWHRGETHYATDLSADDVRTIRAEYRPGGEAAKQLASRFGIKPHQVRKIARREQWRHIPDA